MSFNASLGNLVQRVKIVAASISGRTLAQYNGLDEDSRDQVEHLTLFGYVMNPIAGADALEIQVGAIGSHKVLLGGDHTADALPDMQSGESGLSRGGQQVIIRLTGVEIITPLLKWGPNRTALQRLVQEEFMALYNVHQHGSSGPPNVPMTAAQLTGGT